MLPSGKDLTKCKTVFLAMYCQGGCRWTASAKVIDTDQPARRAQAGLC